MNYDQIIKRLEEIMNKTNINYSYGQGIAFIYNQEIKSLIEDLKKAQIKADQNVK